MPAPSIASTMLTRIAFDDDPLSIASIASRTARSPQAPDDTTLGPSTSHASKRRNVTRPALVRRHSGLPSSARASASKNGTCWSLDSLIMVPAFLIVRIGLSAIVRYEIDEGT